MGRGRSARHLARSMAGPGSKLGAVIRGLATLDAAIDGSELRLYGGPADDLELRYIPFDPLPAPDARVVLVGITPGRTQLRLAVPVARKALSRRLVADAGDPR